MNGWRLEWVEALMPEELNAVIRFLSKSTPDSAED